MKRWLFLIALLCIAAAQANAQSAASAFMPPVSPADAKAALNPIDPALLRQYLARLGPVQTTSAYAGRNDELKSAAKALGEALVAKGCPFAVKAAALFNTRFAEKGKLVYLGGVRSIDAKGIRLKVSAAKLAPGDELWLVAPKVPRAFGPYTAADFRAGDLWLPYASGDTAALMLKTRSKSLPDVSVKLVSHFFTRLGKDEPPEDCYDSIACETSSALFGLAPGVGIGITQMGGGNSMYWTGTLLNNQNTVAFEPYLITAGHCIGNASTGEYYEGFQVFWDFRSTRCDIDDSEDVDTLPTSSVKRILGCDSFLDAAFLELNSVPSGYWGRVYSGWDATPVTAGTPCAAIHHPYGMDMSIAHGTVESIDFQVPELDQGNLVKLDWTQSYLTFGSSGCGVFAYDGTDYYLIGMHSSSPSDQNCQTVNPWGAAASFSEFFPQIEEYLTKADEEPTGCPAEVAFKGNDAALNGLRQVRDQALQPYALGRFAVAGYYAAAPQAAHYLGTHAYAQKLFRTICGPLAAFGRLLP
jgi:hypothetical protein